MKTITLALLTLAAIGCGHNEFDVSPAEVSRHQGARKPGPKDDAPPPPGGGNMVVRPDK